MDIRDIIFKSIAKEQMTAAIRPERDGILSGIDDAVKEAEALGLIITEREMEGSRIYKNRPVMVFKGTPKQMALAEECLIGHLAKVSGIATAAARFTEAADGSFQVVCGSWKKLPASMRDACRRAVKSGGCGIRMLEEPMIYLDKNYVVMLGGVEKALTVVKETPGLENRARVVQVKNQGNLGCECWVASEFGADVIFLDTGCLNDFQELKKAIEFMRRVPRIAFAGNVTLEMTEALKKLPVDIVGVGKAIIDAPMLDMRMDVVAPVRSDTCSCGHHQDETRKE